MWFPYRSIQRKPIPNGVSLITLVMLGAGSRPQVFVDAVNGSDSNDGLTADTPLQTIGAITMQDNLVINLARGSIWREELFYTDQDPFFNLIVQDYGSGTMPTFEGSDVIESVWTQPDAGGHPDVWQTTVTTAANLGGSDGNYASLWEDGVKALPTANITDTDNATEFAFNCVGDGATWCTYDNSGTTTIQIRASDGSNPNTNGKVYEYAARIVGLGGGPGWTLKNIYTRRAISNNGSLGVGSNGRAIGCVAEDGTKHNIFLGNGAIAVDCIAWKTGKNPPAFRSGWSGFVSFPDAGNGAGSSTSYQRCIAIIDEAIYDYAVSAGSSLEGFLWHTDGGEGHDWDSHTFVDCAAKYCAFSGTQTNDVNFTRCHTFGGAGFSTSANVTHIDTWLEEGGKKINRGIQGGDGIITIDGLRAACTIGAQNGVVFVGGTGRCTITNSTIIFKDSSGFGTLLSDTGGISEWSNTIWVHDNTGFGGAVTQSASTVISSPIVDNNVYGNGALDIAWNNIGFNDVAAWFAARPEGIDTNSINLGAADDPTTDCLNGDFTLTLASGLDPNIYGVQRFPTYIEFPDDVTLEGLRSVFSVGDPVEPVEFLNDTFTDTNAVALTSHTADDLSTWTTLSGTVSRINNNRTYSSASASLMKSSVTPPSADYYVEATYDFVGNLSCNIGIVGRLVDSSNFYLFRFSKSSNNWQLVKIAAGVTNNLGSAFSDTFTSGSRTVRLEMVGSTINGYVDGVLQCTATDATFGSAGSVGLRWSTTAQSTTTGRHCTSIRAETVV